MAFRNITSVSVRLGLLAVLLVGAYGAVSMPVRAQEQDEQDCHPGQSRMWVSGYDEPEVAKLVQHELADQGINARVESTGYGEIDNCGTYEQRGIDFAIHLNETPQPAFVDGLLPILTKHAKPVLGNVKLFSPDGQNISTQLEDELSALESIPVNALDVGALSGEPITRKVYVIAYDPLLSNGKTLTEDRGWNNHATLAQQTVDFFKQSTNNKMNYEIVQTTVVMSGWPQLADGFTYTESQYMAVLANPDSHHTPTGVDYNHIVNSPEFDICGKANRGEIDEVWIYNGPWFGFYESTLVGPGAYFYNSGPVPGPHNCNRLIPIMGPSPERGVGESVENFGHRSESTMIRVYGSWQQNNISHNWNKFILVKALSPNFSYGGCGNVHYPANGTGDYDWSNPSTVLSNCSDFANYPNLSDPLQVAQPVSCSVWGCTQVGYFNFWFGHFPSFEGCGPDNVANDWWKYLASPANALYPSLACQEDMHWISGNAGAPNVSMSYVDGTSKTVTSDEYGNYSLPVSNHWSGTITPSRINYIFTPASLSYSDVQTDIYQQNYTSEGGGPATYYVSMGNGDDSNACTSGAAPCRNIQEAVNKAGVGDIVKVTGDRYLFSTNPSPNVVIVNKNLTLSGGWTSDFSSQNGASTIDGGNVNNGILVISGNVTVENFIIENSRSSNSGAVYIVNGNFTLRRSTLRNNVATSNGAGIFLDNGTLTVVNSTISGNTATAAGGGIYASLNGGASVTIQNSTIANNHASQGGGISRTNGTVNLTNTIVANNTSSSSSPDCAGTIAQVNYSLIENMSGCSITSGSNNLNVDPQLSSVLTGAMLVHVPLPGSPVIDAGTSSGCPAIDQLGMARPQGSGCDIGSVESSPDMPTLTPTFTVTSTVTRTPTNTATATRTRTPTRTLTATRTQTATRTPTATSTPTFTKTNTATSTLTFTPTITLTPRNSALWHVKWDASGANNGTSWADAFTDLQSALAVASTGDEIWVASGTYKPTSGTDRTISFVLKNGVTVYGGFLGTEIFFAQRDQCVCNTTLSGDIGVVGDTSDNSYHVVLGSNTDNSAVLDRFTITAGNANQQQLDKGGGMLNIFGSPTITDVTFSLNMAGLGGGLYNGGSPVGPSGSNPILTDVTFVDNHALEGGGMENQFYSSPTLVDVVFRNNVAERSGGGMLNYDHSSPSLTNVTFDANSAGWGGGMANWIGNNPTLNHVTFSENTAEWGGALGNNQSSPNLMNVTFHDNSATTYGGAISNEQNSSPSLTNVTISSNTAVTYGGGIFDDGSGGSTLTNVTVSGNTASSLGGGVYNQGGSFDIRNSILYGNTGGELEGPANVSYSIVQGGYPGVGNLDSDPLLGPLEDNGGPFTLTMKLGPDSPAIDAGNDSICPVTDQRGMPRPQGMHCDIGAFEYRHVLHYVKWDATGGNTGTSWENAFTDLQDALAVPLYGDEIWVAAGTYYPTTGTDRTISFKLQNGVAMYGGFSGIETSREQRDFETNMTMLSGDIGIVGDNSDNSYHVVSAGKLNDYVGSTVTILNKYTVLDGFTITAGNASDESEHNDGGGMINLQSHASIANIIFEGNSAVADGGGLRNAFGHPTLTNVIFRNNSAHSGGGISNLGTSALTLSNVIFADNTASNRGGGMSNSGSSPRLNDVTFANNFAVSGGGGMSNTAGSPILTSVTFVNNSTDANGGGMLNVSSNPILTNVTFKNNSATSDGGGMSNSASNPSLMDVTFTSNSANTGGGMSNTVSEPTLSNVTFTNNLAITEGGGMKNSASGPSLADVTFMSNSANTGGGICNTASDPILTNVTFTNNSSTSEGGGMNNKESDPTLTNVTFSGNSAVSNGGGLYNSSSSPTLINTTFSENYAGIQGGGIYNQISSNTVLRNSILWGNHAPTGADMYTYHVFSNPIASNSIIGSAFGNLSGTNIITQNPMLGQLGRYGGETETIPLMAGSAAIDAGKDADCPATDQRSVTRPQGAHCDIGAFEYEQPSTATPTYTATSTATSTSTSTPTSTATASQTLTPTATKTPSSTPTITRTPTNTRVPIIRVVVNANDSGVGSLRQTILDSISGDVVTFAPSLAGETIRLSTPLIIATKGLTIDGSVLNPPLILSGENVSQIMDAMNTFTVTISGLAFTKGNGSTGGAIEASGSGDLKIVNCSFYENQADGGGAIYKDGTGDISIVNSSFYQNQVRFEGGAIYSDSSGDISIVNSSLYQNYAGNSGGAISVSGGGDHTIVNSTITQNEAGTYGGAIDASGFLEIAVFNSTFAGNSAPQGSEIFAPMFQTRTDIYNTLVACSISSNFCVTGMDINRNSIIAPGMLADFGLGELADNGGSTKTMAVLPGSLLIDAGDDAICAAEPVNNLDQRGVVRPQGSHCDIGAFEYKESPTPTPTHTATSTATSTATPTSTSTSTNTPTFTPTNTQTHTSTPTGTATETRTPTSTLTSTPTKTATTTKTATVVPVAKPGIPVLISPANGVLLKGLQPVLDWKDSNPAAHRYQVQVSTNSGFTALVVNDSNVMTSTFTPDLLPGKLYYWRVRAFNGNSVASGWSSVRTFKTPLSQPTLVSPLNGDALLTDRPAFNWDAVPGAASYILQVSSVNNFSTLLVNTTVHTTDYTMTKDLPQNKTLYWRVRAKTSAVTGPWSAKWTFKTGNPPSVPVLASPANGVLIKDYTPPLNWKDSTVPAGTTFRLYELQVDDNNNFLSPVIETTAATSQFTPLSDLASNTKYYWRVRAVNTVNSVDHVSGWSPVWSFRTVIHAPQSLTMIPGLSNLQRPSFEWDAATGTGAITGYTIQVSTSASFSTLLVNTTVRDSTYAMGRNLPYDRTIYWRVRVNGVNGPSAWTVEQFSITTGLP